MPNATALKSPPAQSLLDPDEQEERRETLRRAQHDNDLEGCHLHPRYLPVVEAYIRGEIDSDGYHARIRAIDGIPDWEDAKRRLAAGETVPGYWSATLLPTASR